MAGIDKITREIEQDADAEAAKIISAAEEAAKTEVDKANQQKDEYL